MPAQLEEVLRLARARAGLHGQPRQLAPSLLDRVRGQCGVEPPADLVRAWTWLYEPDGDKPPGERFNPESAIVTTDELQEQYIEEHVALLRRKGPGSKYLCLDPGIVARLQRGLRVDMALVRDLKFDGGGEPVEHSRMHFLFEWVAWEYLGEDDWKTLGINPAPYGRGYMKKT
jgi:hypothetical protein